MKEKNYLNFNKIRLKNIKNYLRPLLTKIKQSCFETINRSKNLLRNWILKKKILLSSGKLLIVRTDGIGDYVLFRNFIHFLRKERLFKNYRFILLGNIAFKSLAEKYEQDVIDEFIWIDPSIFYNPNLSIKKNELVIKLREKKYDIILNPVHSRFWEADEFISSLNGKILIGSKGDDVNFFKKDLYQKSLKIYDLLIDVMDTSFFEFYRNNSFVKALTNSDKRLPQIKIDCVPPKKEELTILIFPGASAAFRRWDPSNFSKLIIQLNELEEPIKFIIAGSVADQLFAEEILETLPNEIRITDKTGKTDLVELVNDIGSVHLVISNETCAVHFAATTGTPAVCISNGERFGRFSPYPESIASNIYTIYPNEKFYKTEYKNELNLKYRLASDLNLNDISVNRVVSKVQEILLKRRQVNLHNSRKPYA